MTSSPEFKFFEENAISLDWNEIDPIHRCHTASGSALIVEATSFEHLEKGFASAVFLDKSGNGKGDGVISEAQDWV